MWGVLKTKKEVIDSILGVKNDINDETELLIDTILNNE
jgi:hypothetical protein